MMKFDKKSKFVFILLCMVALVSCSVDYEAEVQSDTSWSGSFGNRSVDGSGNRTIDLPDEHPQCCVVQKDTEAGYLRVRITAEGGGIFGPDDTGWVETTAAYGIVSVCSND